MVKRILMMTILFVFVLGAVCGAAKLTIKPVISNYNQQIIINDGNIQLKNINLYISKGTYGGTDTYIYGDIINNTDKNWRDMTIGVQYLDSLGRIIYQGDLKVYHFKSFSTNTIGYDVNAYKSNYSGSQYDVSGWDNISNIDLKNVTSIRFVLENSELEGTPHIKLIEPEPSDNLGYSDDLIDVAFNLYLGRHTVDISLKNKTSVPIKVDWNQVSFVSINGSANKVIHEGIKLISSGEMQSPSYIPPRATLSDIIAPTSNFYWSDGWQYIPILPEGQNALSNVGKSFSIYLPLEINGEIKHYNFVFEIDRADNI